MDETTGPLPFGDPEKTSIHNEEPLKEEGKIGAEKIFNFIKRFNEGNMLEALKKGINIIKNRTKYIRAMNIIISDKGKVYVVSIFNEDSEYFTMHCKKDNKLIICSEKYPNEEGWEKIENNTMKVF